VVAAPTAQALLAEVAATPRNGGLGGDHPWRGVRTAAARRSVRVTG